MDISSFTAASTSGDRAAAAPPPAAAAPVPVGALAVAPAAAGFGSSFGLSSLGGAVVAGAVVAGFSSSFASSFLGSAFLTGFAFYCMATMKSPSFKLYSLAFCSSDWSTFPYAMSLSVSAFNACCSSI